jgi:hypothetical protein
VDNLTSTVTDMPLSAAQGKALNDAKAPLASPAFTGTPTVPTANIGNDSEQIANTAFVKESMLAGIGGEGGLYSFDIDDNKHLIVSFDDNARNPGLHIDESGHLIWQAS